MTRYGRLVSALAGLLILSITPATAQPPNICWGAEVNDFRSTDDADFLSGTEEEDVAALGTGDDQYFAASLGDTICGNEGADVVVGQTGGDFLVGGEGDDLVVGLGGPDSVNGGLGTDEVRGDRGDDVIRGGLDNDRDDLWDGFGSDTIIGGEEDIWHRCFDDETDPHEDFLGTIVPDPDCT